MQSEASLTTPSSIPSPSLSQGHNSKQAQVLRGLSPIGDNEKDEEEAGEQLVSQFLIGSDGTGERLANCHSFQGFDFELQGYGGSNAQEDSDLKERLNVLARMCDEISLDLGDLHLTHESFMSSNSLNASRSSSLSSGSSGSQQHRSGAGVPSVLAMQRASSSALSSPHVFVLHAATPPRRTRLFKGHAASHRRYNAQEHAEHARSPAAHNAPARTISPRGRFSPREGAMSGYSP